MIDGMSTKGMWIGFYSTI